MEILYHKTDHRAFLTYLPHIKSSLREWLFIEVHLTDRSDKNFTVNDAANLLQVLFKDKEGKLYICNDNEIIVVLHWGKTYTLSEVTRTVEQHLPEGSCEVHVQEPTPEGLAKLEILITYRKPVAPTFSDIRRTRMENVIMVADDDMYMRMLVKKGVPPRTRVCEVVDGGEIIAAYKKYMPDILFLEIHMPNADGTDVLRSILEMDPAAYVVMLSADSSQENVEWTTQNGAKEFLAKPFSKDRLMECVKECPTIL